jgi:diguanylate cyclase (GGDEF)-like protein
MITVVEKRRFKRTPTVISAQLSALHSAPLACEIMDYCPQGVMIYLPDMPAPHLSDLLHKQVALKFVDGQDGARIHRFTGRVVRITPGILGVEIDQFHPDTIQALSRATIQDAHVYSSQAEPDGTHVSELIPLCQRHFTPFIQNTFATFFEQLESTFKEAGLRAPNSDEQHAFNSVPALLSTQRSLLEHVFFKPDYWVQALNSATLPGPDTASLDNLSLIEISDFEDWLNAAQSIKSLETSFEAETITFTTRYNHLIAPPISRHNNPCGPLVLISVFRQAITKQGLTASSRALLYTAFGAALAEHYAAFYQGLNAALPKPEIPPGEPKQPVLSASTAIPPPDVIAENEIDTGVLAYKLDHIIRHLNLSQIAPPSHLPGQADINPSPEQSMMHTTGSLWSSLRQMRDDQVGQPVRAAPSGQNNLLENILDTLNQLRAQPDSSVAEGEAATFKQRLVSALPQLAQNDVQGDQHFQTVELFDALLSQPLAHAVKDSDIASLLKKLELPLLKLALTDANFLDSDTHAARQTVNLFERYYVAADDTGKVFDPELLSLLDGLATRVVEQFETHPDVYDEVNAVLQKLIAPLEDAHRHKSEQLHLHAEAYEKIHLAHEQVEQILAAHLGKQTLPTIVLTLIHEVWKPHLQLLYLRAGSEHAEFTQALSVLDTLRDALSGQQPLPTSSRQTLMSTLVHGLKAVLLDPARIETLARDLNAAIEGGIEITHAHYPTVTPSIPDTPTEQSTLKLLRRGDWLSFNRDGHPVPYQLVWSNPARSRFMFINRSATMEHPVDSHTLAHSLHSGDTQPLSTLNTPFMQRSAHNAMLSAYERLYQQAIHDTESGLLNRKGLMNLLNKLFIPGLRELQSSVLCLFVFDQLKAIHQGCEQAEAAASLHELTKAMRVELRHNDAFARLGEDTFVILFQDRPIEEVHAITQDILARIAQHRCTSAGKSFAIGVNAGMAEISSTVESSSALLKNAASACVSAKSHGVNTVQIYRGDSAQIQDEESLYEWAGLIDKALAENLLHLRCQKIQPVHADGGHLPHYEILLGLDASLKTNPQGFIRAAEKWKRSADIDLWVVRNSFDWIQKNTAKLGSVSGFSINLSGLSLINQGILDTLTQALASPDFPVDKIIFEVTETAAIENLAAAQDFIAQVKALGCRVSLDDFGSGYSSFAYLKKLDVDYLKIDGAFVRDLLKDKADLAMVKSMHDVGHALGLKTIAEYVENVQILDKLREIGVDYAQGWQIAKPVPLDSLVLE